MELIGSIASPYVRRIRILLDELHIDYTFTQVQVFSKEGQDKILKHTKTKRVPILIDNDVTIWDSHLISKYILEKSNKKQLSLEDEKEIILINEANDSGIILFQLKYFELDKNLVNNFSKIQVKRIEEVLTYFNEKMKTLPEWGLVTNFLYCMIDWFKFREVIDWSQFKNLVHFHNSLKEEVLIKKTTP